MCGLSALYEATDDIARLGITTSVDGTKAVLSQTTQDAKERAWMLTHRGFSAWIVVDGQTLPEYLVAVDVSAHRVNCWIPSEEGKTFSVYWRDNGGKVDTCAFITLDGFVVPGRFLFGEGVAFREGVRVSESTERPFMFQEVDETGEVSESSAQAAAKEVGMIKLRIKRIARISSRPANAIQPLPDTSLGKRKAGDTCIGFGPEKPAYDQFSTTWLVKPHDNDGTGTRKPSTYVTFVFRYRSKEFLEAQGISTESKKMAAPLTPPTLKRPRVQVRRTASMPGNVPPPLSTPSPSPPKKKQKLSETLFRPGAHHWPRRPSVDLMMMRRAVSWKPNPLKREAFPGEGMLRFNATSIRKDGTDDPGGSESGSGSGTSTQETLPDVAEDEAPHSSNMGSIDDYVQKQKPQFD